MTGKVTAIDYNQPTSETSCQGYTLEFNSYHVNISANVPRTGASGPIVFSRKPQDDTWLDSKHEAITKALTALEEAIIMAIKPNR